MAFEGSKGSRTSVEAILEESTEKLKNLSLQQQQQGSSTSDSQKSSDTSDFEHIESPTQDPDPNSSLCVAADSRELENRIRPAAKCSGGASSDPDNHFACEERSDSELNNDRSTSSVDSDILSSSHSSDTLCNADSGPIQLANGLDSHSITSSRRSKAHEGKKETRDTAEEDSGTDSEYDDNGKSKSEAQYLYFKAEACSQDESSCSAQKCMKNRDHTLHANSSCSRPLYAPALVSVCTSAWPLVVSCHCANSSKICIFPSKTAVLSVYWLDGAQTPDPLLRHRRDTEA